MSTGEDESIPCPTPPGQDHTWLGGPFSPRPPYSSSLAEKIRIHTAGDPAACGPRGIFRASRRASSFQLREQHSESEIRAGRGTGRALGALGERRPETRPPARSTAPAPRRGRGLAGRHLGRLSRRRVYHSMVARSRPAPPQSLSGGAAAAAAPSLYKPQCPDVNGLQCIFQGNLLLSM